MGLMCFFCFKRVFFEVSFPSSGFEAEKVDFSIKFEGGAVKDRIIWKSEAARQFAKTMCPKRRILRNQPENRPA